MTVGWPLVVTEKAARTASEPYALTKQYDCSYDWSRALSEAVLRRETVESRGHGRLSASKTGTAKGFI